MTVRVVHTEKYELLLSNEYLGRFAALAHTYHQASDETCLVIGVKTPYTESEWDLEMDKQVIVVRATEGGHAFLRSAFERGYI